MGRLGTNLVHRRTCPPQSRFQANSTLTTPYMQDILPTGTRAKRCYSVHAECCDSRSRWFPACSFVGLFLETSKIMCKANISRMLCDKRHQHDIFFQWGSFVTACVIVEKMLYKMERKKTTRDKSLAKMRPTLVA
jgi:hypothetical protein